MHEFVKWKLLGEMQDKKIKSQGNGRAKFKETKTVKLSIMEK
jgi:hypothetical protein